MTTWLELVRDGCPECGAVSLSEMSPCEGIHHLEFEGTYDDDGELVSLSKITAAWVGHTDMGEGVIVCQICGTEINVSDRADVPLRYD